MPQCLPPAAAVSRAALLACILLFFTTPAHSTVRIAADLAAVSGPFECHAYNCSFWVDCGSHLDRALETTNCRVP